MIICYLQFGAELSYRPIAHSLGPTGAAIDTAELIEAARYCYWKDAE